MIFASDANSGVVVGARLIPNGQGDGVKILPDRRAEARSERHAVISQLVPIHFLVVQSVKLRQASTLRILTERGEEENDPNAKSRA
jgi:hypothetical protein